MAKTSMVQVMKMAERLEAQAICAHEDAAAAEFSARLLRKEAEALAKFTWRICRADTVEDEG